MQMRFFPVLRKAILLIFMNSFDDCLQSSIFCPRSRPSSCQKSFRSKFNLYLRGGNAISSTETLKSIQTNASFNETELINVFNSAANCDILEQMYCHVLQQNPSHIPTLHNYGNLMMKVRHNYSQAELMYQKVLTIDPQHVLSLCNYGNLLHNHLSNSEQAESMYRKALNFDPAHATTLCNYGLFVQHHRNDAEAAAGWYRKALESDPQHSTTLYNYGRLMQVTPDHAPDAHARFTFLFAWQDTSSNASEAEALFQRALGSDSEHVPVLCSYGLLRLSAFRDADGAEALYRRALRADPGHVATLYNYGALLEGVRQNFSGAVAMYRQVLVPQRAGASARGRGRRAMRQAPRRYLRIPADVSRARPPGQRRRGTCALGCGSSLVNSNSLNLNSRV